jgi:hypothetical protein
MIVPPVPGGSAKALQDAIDDILGPADPHTSVREATEPIELRGGLYLLEAPLRIESAQGFVLRGQGWMTCLAPTFVGPAVINANGCARCQFGNFRITGNGKEQIDNAFWLQWDGKVKRTTTSNVLENIYIIGTRYKAGLRIGCPGLANQCDLTRLTSIYCTGGWIPQTHEDTIWWQDGILVGPNAWGNNVGHHAFDLNVGYHARGVNINVSQLDCYGSNLGGNGTDIYVVSNGYVKFSGGRYESSQRLLQTMPNALGANASTPCPITLENIDWHGNNLHPDGVCIQNGWGGTLRLHQVQITGTAQCPRIRLSGAVPQQLIADGLWVAEYDFADVIDKKNAQASVEVRGFTKTQSGHTVFCH